MGNRELRLTPQLVHLGSAEGAREGVDMRPPLAPSAPQASLLSPPGDEEPQESTDAPPGSETSFPLTTRMAGTTGTAGVSWKIKGWLLNHDAG